MLKIKLFDVYGYDTSDNRSVASFKLDLRTACKKNPSLYFKEVDNQYV